MVTDIIEVLRLIIKIIVSVLVINKQRYFKVFLTRRIGFCEPVQLYTKEHNVTNFKHLSSQDAVRPYYGQPILEQVLNCDWIGRQAVASFLNRLDTAYNACLSNLRVVITLPSVGNTINNISSKGKSLANYLVLSFAYMEIPTLNVVCLEVVCFIYLNQPFV